jgi:hypothetical protein
VPIQVAIAGFLLRRLEKIFARNTRPIMRDSQTKERIMTPVEFAIKTASRVLRSEVTKGIVQLVVGGVASGFTGKAFDKYVGKQPTVVSES